VNFTMATLDGAKAFLDEVAGPVVVKPVSGTGGGRGVTTGVADAHGLRGAAKLAARYDGDLLVEEQVSGTSYRLLFLDGQFLDAVRRDPPAVTGNGRDSIRRLIFTENDKRLNARPITALSPLRVDRDCLNTLRAQGLSPRAVPKPGERVTVKTAVNENSADGNHTVMDQVHPETVALGARLVQDLGVRFAGLDLICRDIRAPLTRANGCFNEVNTTPGVHHHYLVADPSRRAPVAEYVLEYMFRKHIGVMQLGRWDPESQPGAMNIPTYPHAMPAFRSMRPAE
jgi:cyanophycin synthetase